MEHILVHHPSGGLWPFKSSFLTIYQTPALDPRVPIQRDGFDQNPLRARPVVREQARFEAIRNVRKLSGVRYCLMRRLMKTY